MKKAGRPGVTYEQFIEVWEQLKAEGSATLSSVLSKLGGSNSTLINYRERYEQEKNSKQTDILKQIKLQDDLIKVIANIKVEEMELLEKQNQELKARLEEYLKTIKENEISIDKATKTIDELKTQSEEINLDFERKLAASEARSAELTIRENHANEQLEKLREHYNEAKQEAAVAKREIELLREQQQATR